MTDLDIDLSAIGAGRRKKEISAEYVRDLVPADLAPMTGEQGIQPIDIKKLSDRHHQLAKLFASGLSNREVALYTGYTESRISVLKSSPAIKELIQTYRENVVDPQFDAILEHMSGLNYDAVLEIRERLEDEPEKLSTGQLLDIIKTTSDRTGRGPSQTTNHNHNVNLGDKLEAARNRAKEAARSRVIDAEVVEESAPGEAGTTSGSNASPNSGEQ